VSEPSAACFAEQLRTYRNRAQLTHEELAEKSGVQPRTISDLERGKARPRMSTVRQLADALRLTGESRAAFERSVDRSGAGRAKTVRDSGAQGHAARAATAPGTVPRTLPRDISSFTGRAAELARLLAVEPRTGGQASAFVIGGMGGVGKTALAVRAAHDLADRFPDGQLFIDLQGYSRGLVPVSAGSALNSLLKALGYPAASIPAKPADRVAAYRSTLADTRTLIVLDNAAHLDQVRPLLPGSGGCLVIITSRRELGLEDAAVIVLEPPPEAEAVALFRGVAGPGRVAAGDPDLAEIIRLCGSLPLAIQIVAARLAWRTSLSLADALADLHESRLIEEPGDEEHGVTAVIGTSYRHLSEQEQRLFQRLGQIPGPDFDAYAAASVTGDSIQQTRRLLESLLSQHLLVQRNYGRYRFHDLIRSYARSLRWSAGDTQAHIAERLGRLTDYYLYAAQLADQFLDRRLPRRVEPVADSVITVPHAVRVIGTAEQATAWFAGELDNLEAMTRYAATQDAPVMDSTAQGAPGKRSADRRPPSRHDPGQRLPGRAVALVAALNEYLLVHGPWPKAVELHELALRTAERTGDLAGQAEAHASIGLIQRQRGEIAAARESLREALRLHRELGNVAGEAGTLVLLGSVFRLGSERELAEQALRQAAELYTLLSMPLGQAGAYAELGSLHRQFSAFGPAEDSLTRAFDLYHRLDHPAGEAACLTYLGTVQQTVKKLGPAAASLGRALAIWSKLGDLFGQANCLLFLGDVQRETGALDQAEDSLTRALDIYAELGSPRMRASTLSYLGRVRMLKGEYPQADEATVQALSLLREVQDRGGEAETLNNYGALAMATGDLAAARSRYADALALARSIYSRRDEADALEGTGAAFAVAGDVGQARSYLLEALAIFGEITCATDAARVQAALDSLPADAD
jgi:tetratricopeptide (TPR) repeat protein/transcriptional regulator with XRE-family HTH domain